MTYMLYEKQLPGESTNL